MELENGPLENGLSRTRGRALRQPVDVAPFEQHLGPLDERIHRIQLRRRVPPGSLSAVGHLRGDEAAPAVLAVDPSAQQPHADPETAAADGAVLVVADWMIHRRLSEDGLRSLRADERHTSTPQTGGNSTPVIETVQPCVFGRRVSPCETGPQRENRPRLRGRDAAVAGANRFAAIGVLW